MYDENNIFAKILRKEISCNKVYEDENSLFFHDINPQAKIHVLGIPKVKKLTLRRTETEISWFIGGSNR